MFPHTFLPSRQNKGALPRKRMVAYCALFSAPKIPHYPFHKLGFSFKLHVLSGIYHLYCCDKSFNTKDTNFCHLLQFSVCCWLYNLVLMFLMGRQIQFLCSKSIHQNFFFFTQKTISTRGSDNTLFYGLRSFTFFISKCFIHQKSNTSVEKWINLQIRNRHHLVTCREVLSYQFLKTFTVK